MRWVAVVLIMLAACKKDQLPQETVDGSMVDSPNGADPITLDFGLVISSPPPIPQGFVRGPDGGLFALQGNQLVETTDGGATYTIRSTAVAHTYLAATSTALFSIGGSGQVMVSTDNGVNFMDATATNLPTNPTTIPMGLFATPTTLWVRVPGAGTDPPTFWRSTNDGGSFTQVALPSSFAGTWTIRNGGEHVYAYTGQGYVYHYNGSGWDDLGQFALVSSFMVTTAGTALMQASGGFHRRALADSSWTVTASAPYGPTVQRPNGDLVRVVNGGSNGGNTDVSTNDGVSFTSVSITTGFVQSISELIATDTAIVGVSYDSSGYQQLRLPPSSAAWTVTLPPGLPTGPVFKDVSFTSSGRVVVATATKIYTSDNGGLTWRVGSYTFTTPIRSIAVSPSGNRIAVGHATKSYSWIDGNGDTIERDVASLTLPAETVSTSLHVRQMQWRTDNMLFVTTSSDHYTEGLVFEGEPDRIGTWLEINPMRNPTNPQLRATAGYFGVAACNFADSFMLAIGARQWFGTNSYQDHLLAQYQYAHDDFQEAERGPSFGQPLSLSCGPSGVVSVYENDQMFYGDVRAAQRPVMHPTLNQGLQVAKAAPDGTLVVISAGMLYRSTTKLQ